MAHHHPILLLTLALWASREAPAFAQEAQPSSPRVLGRILVLQNERCFEGEVETLDDQYCVRQGMSEIWISGQKVLRVCPDWNAAYRFIRQRANLDDPDERLRLARWCQRHNLLEDALKEAHCALDLRPLHTATRHLISVLKGTIAARKSVPTPAAPAPEPIDHAPAPDLTPETAVHFAVKIQPILLNTCVRCHSNGKGGEFQLYRHADGGQKTALRRNLKSVLAQVRFDDARLSPLLIKAVSPHGATAASPLSGKNSTPYRSLEAWVRSVVEGHPHLREQANADIPKEPTPPANDFATAPSQPAAATTGTAPSIPNATPSPPTPMAVEMNTRPAVAATTPDAAPANPMSTTPPPDPALPGLANPLATTPLAALTPQPAAQEDDVYSPADFNRVAHPGR